MDERNAGYIMGLAKLTRLELAGADGETMNDTDERLARAILYLTDMCEALNERLATLERQKQEGERHGG